MGESLSVLPVVAALAHAAPEVSVLFTTGTRTSATLLERRLAEMGLAARVWHRFVPLDVPGWVARFLDHWRPDACGFVESEIWPNMIRAARARGIPLLLINARLSPKSAAAWRRAPGLARASFGAFARILARSAADGARIAALGGGAVSAPGDLKFAAPPLPVEAATLEALREAIGARPLWLAASVHPGEAGAILACHESLARAHPGLLTLIVPRHPERAAAFGGVLRSRAPPPAGGVYVADTLGELGLFYRLAGIAFIGGSLIAHGGQNPLEAARLGCAIAIGPHTANFEEAVATLAEAGAIARVADAASLASWVDALLRAPGRRAALGAAACAAASRWEELPEHVASVLLAAMAR